MIMDIVNELDEMYYDVETKSYERICQDAIKEIQTLRSEVANGKRLLSEQMELTNERTKLCIELQADNLRLRELLKICTDVFDNVPSRAHIVDSVDENLKRIAQWVNAGNGGAGLYHAIQQALSSTPAQSLAEHDNEVIDRMITKLENAEGELKTLSEYIALLRKEVKHDI